MFARGRKADVTRCLLWPKAYFSFIQRRSVQSNAAAMQKAQARHPIAASINPRLR
jgi:hypothetical protein